MSRRRRTVLLVLTALFVLVPLLEIYLIVQTGQVVGVWWTILLLVAAGFLGSVLVRREGRRAWRALQEALGSGRMPAKELADGALVLVGGTLLVTPGFVSDLVGLFCVLPLTRPLARAVLARVIARRMAAGALRGPGAAPRSGFPNGFPPGFPTGFGTRPGGPDAGTTPGPPRGGPDVVPGEVVDDDR
ncbi:FxsA family protein [Nocardioides sp. HDW12B]|uniref:FxsA family protein n=1 Tax=Nocardioides sp. HDW12B TaxID=2714939 RepID=UPI001409B5B1|nr:FxsA family protein [Nocardioides sp. HDW12B]QIK66451.1 FxsA family protein [Nocardioides sp. HDW12B]